MKKTIIILLLGLLVTSCSENTEQLVKTTEYTEVSSGDSKLSTQNKIVYLDGLLFTGKLIERNNGSIISVKEYKNGKQDGFQYTYYYSGNVNEERYYENGLKTGEHKGWWENGKLKFVYHYKNDMFDGNVKVWNEAGMLFNDFNYINGKEEGSQKAWSVNGEIQANYVVKGNRKYGITGVKDCKTELPKLTEK
jgi:antitoxin component YwqK of YwqJK toxin-antitoxin module